MSLADRLAAAPDSRGDDLIPTDEPEPGEGLPVSDHNITDPVSARDDVSLADGLGQVGAAERDPIDHVETAAQGQLAMAAAGGTHAGHGQALDDQERLRVADAEWGKPGQVTLEGDRPDIDDLDRLHRFRKYL